MVSWLRLSAAWALVPPRLKRMTAVPKYDVAHIRVQSQNLILVLISSSVGEQGSGKTAPLLSALEASAKETGLLGNVALVWNNGGRVRHYGPPVWGLYLSSLTWSFILANVNRRLTAR
jgi:hypothetical protein